MKLILEKYLYLLTEDPQMDAYEENYKKTRAAAIAYHKKYNPQRLTAQYANVPKEKIPKDIKKILDDYYKLTEEMSEAGRMKQAYSRFMRGEGPKPSPKTAQSSGRSAYNGFSKAADDWFNKSQQDFSKKMDDIRDSMNDSVRKRFHIHNKPIKGGKIFAGAAIILAVMALVNRAMAKRQIAIKRTCSNLTGRQKQKCILSNQILAEKEKIKILYNSLAKANNTKNPEEFKQRILQKINISKNQISILERKLQQY